MTTLALTLQTLGGLLPLAGGLTFMAVNPRFRTESSMRAIAATGLFGMMLGGVGGHAIAGEPTAKRPSLQAAFVTHYNANGISIRQP